jgi:hypothetical protein
MDTAAAAPRAIESYSIEEGWQMYARLTIPPYVPEDDFTRARMYESYTSGAAAVVILLLRLEQMPDAADRRAKFLDQLHAECHRISLATARTAGSAN